MTSTDEFDAPADDEPTLEDYQEAAAVVRAEQADATSPAVGELPEAEQDESTEDDKPSSKREARYRVQLRETEAERDQLQGTVEALQRAEVERIAGQSIQKPAAIWSADVDLTTLLDDTGRVDPIKVSDAVKQATNTLGLAPTRPAGFVRGEGHVVAQPAEPDPWAAAFK